MEKKPHHQFQRDEQDVESELCLSTSRPRFPHPSNGKENLSSGHFPGKMRWGPGWTNCAMATWQPNRRVPSDSGLRSSSISATTIIKHLLCIKHWGLEGKQKQTWDLHPCSVSESGGCSFDWHLLSAYCIPDTVLGAGWGDTAIKKTNISRTHIWVVVSWKVLM